jgi:hypothetical protein
MDGGLLCYTPTFPLPCRATWCFSGSDASTTPSRRPRDDMVAPKPEARRGCCSAVASSSMRVHSHRWVRAMAAAQPRRNEQTLPVEHLCKFYPSGDMSGSVLVYATQVFHTVNRSCLSCSLISILSRNRSGAAKTRWCLNELRFSAAVSAHWWWFIVSVYGISSHMWCHVLDYGYLILYLRLFKAPLFFHLWVFASLLSGVLLTFLCLKGLVCAKMFAKLGCCMTLCPFP